MTPPAPLLPPLLFRQMLILAFAAGAGSVRAPAVGAALLALLLIVPSWKEVRLFVNRAAACVLVFATGWTVMQLALAEVPDKPSWSAVPRRAVLVQGQVSSVAGLPGGRVRVLLESLRPVAQECAEQLLTDAARKAMKARLPDGTDGGRKAYAGAVFSDDTAASGLCGTDAGCTCAGAVRPSPARAEAYRSRSPFSLRREQERR